MDDLKLNESFEVYSFDVFDTTITRCTASSYGIFALMKQKLIFEEKYSSLPWDLVREFYDLRIDAERLARVRRSKKDEEITLKTIYNIIANNFGLSIEKVNLLMKLEMEIEKEYSFPIGKTVNTINKLTNIGKKVIFISDMYWGASFIRELLDQACVNFKTIPLFVSSDYGKTKSSGNLYELIAKKENLQYKDWMHVGDSISADIEAANKKGITTFHVDFMNNTPFERFVDVNLKHNVYSQVFIGCTKLSRLEDDEYLFRIGCNYGGALVVSYAMWIINQCVDRNIRNIYFISRDGYILKKVIDIINDNQNIGLNTQYIYGSRKAWRTKDKNQLVLLRKYLQQELNLLEEDLAIVDVFGSGYSVDCLCDIIQEFSNTKIHVFHYKLSDVFSDSKSFKYSFGTGIDIWDNIELFFSAPHASCIGYMEDEMGKVVPLYNNEEGILIKSFNYDNYTRGILVFLKYYLQTGVHNNKNGCSILESVNLYFKYINEFPNDELLKFIVEFPRIRKNKFRNSIVFFMERKMEMKIKKIKYIFKVLEKSKYFNLLKE